MTAHHSLLWGRVGRAGQTSPPKRLKKVKQPDLPKVKSVTRTKGVGRLFSRDSSPPQKVTPSPKVYTVTAESNEARVIPEHQAWTLVLLLPLTAMTFGKSHPHPRSQFLNLSNGGPEGSVG